ncbi:hypothetical protein B7463_g9033, partial [Scytalidium lignicola]
MAKTFPLFPRLPAELKLKIWEVNCRKPGIHIFDVCFPISKISSRCRSKQAFTGSDGTVTDKATYQTYRDQIFFDTLDITSEISDEIYTTRFRTDPSMYRITTALSAACIDSAKVIKTFLDKGNIIYLPRKRERVLYDSTSDVLCLRFGSCTAAQDLAHDFPANNSHVIYQNNISRVLEGMWSREMAESLCAACRVALDVSELWCLSKPDPIVIEELAMLCSCIHHDLETVYLVDYCIGRCQQCCKGKLMPKELQTRKCNLARDLDPEDREMDIVYGAGVIYREICDFERLGWESGHPVFVLAQTMGKIIREQQGENGPFQSVRLLACEDEAADEGERIVDTTCRKDQI